MLLCVFLLEIVGIEEILCLVFVLNFSIGVLVNC